MVHNLRYGFLLFFLQFHMKLLLYNMRSEARRTIDPDFANFEHTYCEECNDFIALL
jgi:hypothetical protein